MKENNLVQIYGPNKEMQKLPKSPSSKKSKVDMNLKAKDRIKNMLDYESPKQESDSNSNIVQNDINYQ